MTTTMNLYNIASTAAQSHSVYVSVLKIPIVLADGVQVGSPEFFFFARVALVSAGKNFIFRYNNGYKTETRPTSSKTKTIVRPLFMG